MLVRQEIATYYAKELKTKPYPEPVLSISSETLVYGPRNFSKIFTFIYRFPVFKTFFFYINPY